MLTSGSEIIKSKYLVNFHSGNRLDHACLVFGNQGKVDFPPRSQPVPSRSLSAFQMLGHEQAEQGVQAGAFLFGQFFETMGQSPGQL
jgi:hypothetical protein